MSHAHTVLNETGCLPVRSVVDAYTSTCPHGSGHSQKQLQRNNGEISGVKTQNGLLITQVSKILPHSSCVCLSCFAFSFVLLPLKNFRACEDAHAQQRLI